MVRLLKRRISNWVNKEKEPSPFFLVENKDFTSKHSVGRFTYGLPRVIDFQDKNAGKLHIGSFCSIAENVTILLSGNHRVDWVTTYPFNKVLKSFANKDGHPTGKGDVIIGNDVWIGMDSLILSGVKIGDGSVIGARSVVTKDVEPYTIVAGNPARYLKHRFNSEQIQQLITLKWWDKDIEWIERNMDLLLDNDIDTFIQELKK